MYKVSVKHTKKHEIDIKTFPNFAKYPQKIGNSKIAKLK